MAIHAAVTVSLVSEARGGPFVFWHDLSAACATAAELGFDAVELFPPSAAAVDPGVLRALLAEHGLKLAAVGTGAGWVIDRLTLTLPDAAARERALAFVRSIIDFAGPLGAPAIIGSMQGSLTNGADRDATMKILAQSLNELGDHAKQYHVPLLYEPLNRYETNLVNTIAAGVDLLKTLDTDNVRLLADLFHMNIEEADIAAALRAGAGCIGHVHFVDSNRRAAGFGHLDYKPVAAALADIGYSGYLSAEALPMPDPKAAARQTIEEYRKWFPT